MIISKNDENSVEIASEILKNGGIAILPTDTVYGFSGIVNSFSDAKIREIKGRAETKPFIRLIARPQDVFNYTNDAIPPEILEKWPGALTIIVRTEKDKTVAFRCPGDSWLRSVIKNCGSPIFSTSVNKSGRPILETPRQIINAFCAQVDLIVEDGEKLGATPSTLISIENGRPKILRQGDVIVS